jgi:hypothetical protein
MNFEFCASDSTEAITFYGGSGDEAGERMVARAGVQPATFALGVRIYPFISLPHPAFACRVSNWC